MRRQIVLMIVLAMSLMAANLANADSQTWFLTGTNSGQLPCTSMQPCAEVMLTASGNSATFTVTSLLNGWIFDTFGFNTIAGVNVSLVSASGEVGAYSLGGPGNQDGWGSFKYIFDTGKNGGSNGSDCMNAGPGCTFTFTLSSASTLSVASFEVLSSGGAGSGFFAGHMASNTNSGYSGDSVPVPVPEPTTTLVLSSGLLMGAGLMGRRALNLFIR